MFRRDRTPMRILVLIATTFLATGAVWAERPDAGEGPGRDPSGFDPGYDRNAYRGYGDRRDHPYADRRADDYPYLGPPIDFRFDEHARGAIHGYYGERLREGRCPPGLVKRNGGCVPPAHGRAWRRGQPLPPGIGYYALPPDLLRRLPPPPPHHRYVRVGPDILLIAIGTALVIDAIEDIGRY